MMQKWQKTAEKIVFKTPWFSIADHTVILPNGKEDHYYVKNQSDGVGIFAMTKNKEVILIREYKYPVNDVILTLPAGLSEDGESMEESMVRELKEETGYTVGNIEKIESVFVNATMTDMKFHMFFATDCELTQAQELQSTEQVEIVLVPIEELKNMLKQQKISTLGALGMLYHIINIKDL